MENPAFGRFVPDSLRKIFKMGRNMLPERYTIAQRLIPSRALQRRVVLAVNGTLPGGAHGCKQGVTL